MTKRSSEGLIFVLTESIIALKKENLDQYNTSDNYISIEKPFTNFGFWKVYKKITFSSQNFTSTSNSAVPIPNKNFKIKTYIRNNNQKYVFIITNFRIFYKVYEGMSTVLEEGVLVG